MRHPLDNFIAGWLDENSEAFVFLSDDEDPNADGMVEIRGEVNISALARAILDQFAVVDLPEPDGTAEAGQPYWDSSDYVEADDGQVYLCLSGDAGYRSTAEARDLAGALIAAANRAETQS